MAESGRGEAPPQWISLLIDQGIEAFAVFDDDLKVAYANQELADLLDHRLDDLLGSNAFDLVHAEDIERAAANVVGVGDGARPDPGLMRLRRGDGTWCPYQIKPRRVHLPPPPDGPGTVTAVTVRDHTSEDAHWLFLARLTRGEDFHSCIEQFTASMSTQVDGPMAVTYETGGSRCFAGTLPAELAWPDPMPAESPWAEALRTGRPAMAPVSDLPDEVRPAADALGLAALVVVPVEDPAHELPAFIVQGPYELVIAEIVMIALSRKPHDALSIAFGRRDAMAQLHQLAMTDPLTGLANRTALFETLEQLDAAGTCYTISSVDVDRFKAINDNHGHQVGDGILVACADRLRKGARPSDLVARLGGDEFAVVHVDVGPEEAGKLAEVLVEALNQPVEVGDLVFELGASVGIASARPGASADHVLAASDTALYAAKRAGRGTWRSMEVEVTG